MVSWLSEALSSSMSLHPHRAVVMCAATADRQSAHRPCHSIGSALPAVSVVQRPHGVRVAVHRYHGCMALPTWLETHAATLTGAPERLHVAAVMQEDKRGRGGRFLDHLQALWT